MQLHNFEQEIILRGENINAQHSNNASTSSGANTN